jgi:hypothetical protein
VTKYWTECLKGRKVYFAPDFRGFSPWLCGAVHLGRTSWTQVRGQKTFFNSWWTGSKKPDREKPRDEIHTLGAKTYTQ